MSPRNGTSAPGGPGGQDDPSSWPKRGSQMIQTPMPPPPRQEPLHKPLRMAGNQGNTSRKEAELLRASPLIQVPHQDLQASGTTQASSPVLPPSHSSPSHTDLLAVPKTPQAFSGFKDLVSWLFSLPRWLLPQVSAGLPPADLFVSVFLSVDTSLISIFKRENLPPTKPP